MAMSRLLGSALAPGAFAKPALSPGVRSFIVGRGVALEETAQNLGMSRLA
jgi:hypothetical protein